MLRIRQSGTALLVTIWVVTLMAVMASVLAHEVLTASKNLEAQSERSEAESLAEGAINRSILSLISPSSALQQVDDSSSGSVNVVVGDEDGKVDINAGSIELLKTVVRSAAASDEEFRALVTDIENRRSHVEESDVANDSSRGKDQRKEMERRYLSLDDWFSGKALKESTVECLRSATTVFTQSEGIDFRVAGELVRKAAALTSGDSLTPAETQSPTDAQRSNSGRAFSIGATATLKGGLSVTRRTIVRITGSKVNPYWILEYREEYGALSSAKVCVR